MGEITLPNGVVARTMTYEMSDFLRSCVNVYLSLAGEGTRLRKVGTPFSPEDQQHSYAGSPACGGTVVEWPWRLHTFPPVVGKDVSALPNRKGGASTTDEAGGGTFTTAREDGEGVTLQPIAAKVLMKVLYAARMARFDLLRAVCKLARSISKWDEQCDKRIHR